MTETHDLTDCYWGHNIEFMWRQDNGDWRVCVFLSRQIKPGDSVLAASQSGGKLQYRVIGEVERPMDPGDQHFATLHFEGREPSE